MTTFGSICSGIEAASVAFEPLGWQAAWFSEIDPFASAVLQHHYPAVTNHGDMTKLLGKILGGLIAAPDVIVGGTPCQAFSVAGKRESLDDERGNLSLTFCKIIDAADAVRPKNDPCKILWENVPGVLSTKDNAFGCFLAELAGESVPLVAPGGKWSNAGAVFGPKRAVAWRVLDAQYFGLAQRRRRVFVVASARKGFDPAAVLFEWDSVRRDTAPSREAGEEAAATLDARAEGGGFPGTDGACGGHVVPHTAQCLTTGTDQRYDTDTETLVTHTLRGEGFDAPAIAFNWNAQADQLPGPDRDTSINDGLTCSQQGAVAVREVAQTITSNYGKQCDNSDTGLGPNVAIAAMQVRRLTPRECERLQGFPDDYTLIPWRKKPASECPDGPRYKALGNSWAVPVVRWIASRMT